MVERPAYQQVAELCLEFGYDFHLLIDSYIRALEMDAQEGAHPIRGEEQWEVVRGERILGMYNATTHDKSLIRMLVKFLKTDEFGQYRHWRPMGNAQPAKISGARGQFGPKNRLYVAQRRFRLILFAPKQQWMVQVIT